MRSVKLEEFYDRPAEYLESGESLSIEQDGRVIGRYLPVPNGTDEQPQTERAMQIARPTATAEETRERLDRLDQAVKRVLAETGMTEDELANLFDLNKPLPYDN